MPRYRTKVDQYFMGQYYEMGTVLELHEKQAKYPLMSGQIEPVDPVFAQPKGKAKATAGTEDNPVTPHAARMPPNRMQTAALPPKIAAQMAKDRAKSPEVQAVKEQARKAQAAKEQERYAEWSKNNRTVGGTFKTTRE